MASNKICKGYEWVLNHNQALKFIDDIKSFMLIPYKINQIKKCKIKSQVIWTKKFKCSFCDKIYSDPSGRRRHEKNIHINNNVLHQCLLCDKKYKSRCSMKRHIKLNHNSVASIS